MRVPLKREKTDVIQSPSRTGATREPVSLTVEAGEFSYQNPCGSQMEMALLWLPKQPIPHTAAKDLPFQAEDRYKWQMTALTGR